MNDKLSIHLNVLLYLLDNCVIVNSWIFLVFILPRSSKLILIFIFLKFYFKLKSNHNYSSFDYYSSNQYYGIQFCPTIGFHQLGLFVVFERILLVLNPHCINACWFSIWRHFYGLDCMYDSRNVNTNRELHLNNIYMYDGCCQGGYYQCD